MKKFIEVCELPAEGQTEIFHVAEVTGNVYTLTRINPKQFALQFKGRHVCLLDFPTPPKGAKVTDCTLGVEFDNQGANWWLQRKPEAYSCPIRRAMAEQFISQKALEYKDNIEDYETSIFTAYDAAWTEAGGKLVALIHWAKKNCGVTGNRYYRAEKIEIVPEYKKAVMDWVIEALNNRGPHTDKRLK